MGTKHSSEHHNSDGTADEAEHGTNNSSGNALATKVLQNLQPTAQSNSPIDLKKNEEHFLQSSHNKNDEKVDFGSPSDIETYDEKFLAPLNTDRSNSAVFTKKQNYQDRAFYNQSLQLQLSSSASNFFSPHILQPIAPYQFGERPNAAGSNVLDTEMENDIQKKMSLKNSKSIDRNIAPELMHPEMLIPVPPPSTIAPFAYHNGASFSIKPTGRPSLGADFSLNSASFSENHDLSSVNTSHWRQSYTQQMLSKSEFQQAPMSAMGMFVTPLFVTGSSLFSPVDFNHLPGNEMNSATGSLAENSLGSRFGSNTMPMSKQDAEAFANFKKSHAAKFDEGMEIHRRKVSVETSKKLHENLSSTNTHVKKDSIIEHDLTETMDGKSSQFDNKGETMYYRNSQPQLVELREINQIPEYFLSNHREDNSELAKNTNTFSEKLSARKRKVGRPRKVKPKPLPLNAINSNLSEADDVKVDYADAIFGANVQFDSLQLLNPFISPVFSNNSPVLDKNGEQEALENNSDYINLLVLREKAIELGLSSASKEDVRMAISPEGVPNKEPYKSKKLNVKKVMEKKSFKRTKKPTPIPLVENIAEVKNEKIGNIFKTESDVNVVELDDQLESSSDAVLTRSTKLVIDQIKHDALNGKNSKLFTFSPIHSSKSTLKDTANTVLTQPLLIQSADNGHLSHTSGAYSDLDTSKHMNKLKKISPLDTHSAKVDDFYQRLSDINSASPVKKPEFLSLPEKTQENNNPVTNAIKSTMQAIMKSGKKKKLKSATFLDDQSSNSDFLQSSSKKISKKTTSNIKKTSTLASNDFIKAQYISVPDNKLKNNLNVLGKEKDSGSFASGKHDGYENDIDLVSIPYTDNATTKTNEPNIGAEKLTSTDLKPELTDEIGKNPDTILASPNKIVNRLEDIFKNKHNTQRKQLINVSTQMLTSSGNLIVKSSGRSQANKAGQINLNWRNKVTVGNEKVAEDLLNDPYFTMEQLTKPKKGLFSCLHCTLKFSSILEYAYHLDSIDYKRPYKCPFNDCCWKYLGMTTPAKLRRHCALQHMSRLNDEMKRILNIKADSYPEIKCSHRYCDKVFMRKDSITRHLQMVHETANSRFNQRQKKVMNLMATNFSHLADSEQEVLIKEYMSGALALPNASKARGSKKK